MNSLTLDDLEWFAREAEYFRIAEVAAGIAGFLICLRPDTAYASPNFRWLNERFDDFLYIDRVAVAPLYHRKGVASALYTDAAAQAPPGLRMLACEVNLRPRNSESIRFHERQGFEPVGSQDHGYVQVQYMVRRLPY